MRRYHGFQGYVIAVVTVLAALGFTIPLQHLFAYPFLFLFFAAVMTSAWFGGTGPGLFSVLLSTALVDYFFLRPLHSLAINSADFSYFLAFVACSLLASSISAAKKRDENALKDARDRLEIRVEERTAALQNSNRELTEREHQLRLLTEVIPQQIWSGSASGAIDYGNSQMLTYTGCELQDMSTERFMQTLHPQDRAPFEKAWQHALATGSSLSGEWRFRRSDGEHRTFFTRAVPLFTPEGKLARWYATNTDIEDHKSAEEALLQTQNELAHLSRSLTMGELTASIAHELNQPLAAVVGYGSACGEWLSANPPNVEEAKIAADKVVQDGTRAGLVIRRIRALFQKTPAAKQPIQMNELIHEMQEFVRSEARQRKIAVEIQLADTLPLVVGDRVQLQQVILNLMMNGIEALRDTPNSNKRLVVRTSQSGSGDIIVQVEDNGPGLTPGVENRIFEPFFTTKPQGLGMGLAISRSIVESHGGKLIAVPQASDGAIFQMNLPVRNGPGNE